MVCRLLLVGVLAAGFSLAQDEGGGGGGGGGGGRGGGGGGGGVAPSVMRSAPAPLDMMATACNLSKDQKKQFKTVLDAASKSAATLRKQIPDSREAIGKAVETGKSADEIKKLVDENGLMRAQVAEMEYKAFAELYKTLDADQRKAGAQRLLGMLNGILMKKNWDE